MGTSIDRASLVPLPRPVLARSLFNQRSILASPSESERAFLEISQKSPIERLRDKVLADMKTSEEQMAQMAPEERQTIEDEIQRRMKDALDAGTRTSGSRVDQLA